MKPLSLIHTSWLKPFGDYFAKRRVSLSPYLDEAQIEARQVSSGEGWISKHQLYCFLNAIAEGEKMPELGFVVGETIAPASLGAIGEAIGAAKTLGEAIRVFCQMINRHTEENRSWVEEGDENGEVWWLNETTNPFPADRRIADHAGLMSLVNVVRLATGSGWYPEKMALQTGKTAAYRKVMGLRKGEISFDCPATGLAFSAQWLIRPIGSAGESIPIAPNEDGLLAHDERFDDRLRRLLRAILGVGGIGPTVDLMASICGISLRTFHRRLGEVGCSYRELLDETRLHQAKRLLVDPELSVKQIAFELGYSGSNNFVRAFKRMTGATPTSFRNGVEGN